jgi:hypothetical protein
LAKTSLPQIFADQRRSGTWPRMHAKYAHYFVLAIMEFIASVHLFKPCPSAGSDFHPSIFFLFKFICAYLRNRRQAFACC